jgi:hypothetical protein
MNYALNLADDGRILSVTFEKYAPKDAVLVEELPEGNVADYLYVEGAFIYDPIPIEEVEETPTQLDRIEAQVAYTAMMTDTLLEV